MYPWGPFSQIPSTTHVGSSQTSSTPPHEASSTGWDKSVQPGTAKTPNTVAFEGARALRRPITSASYATPESVWMLKSCSTTHSGTTMKKPPNTPQGSYQYDPLNRLIISNTTRRFYQNERIATEIEGTNARRFMAFDAQPLAVQEAQATTLLATDLQTSVLHHVSAAGTQACAYTPFGHHSAESGITRLLGFNGEHPEAVTGHYLLGKGYRAYNPVLMRFNSPDSWSPFGEGGINAYAYSNKPLNEVDPTGHASIFKLLNRIGKGIGNKLGLRERTFKASVVDNLPTVLTNNRLPKSETSAVSSNLPSSPPSYGSHKIKTSHTLNFETPPPIYEASAMSYRITSNPTPNIQRLDLPPDYWSANNLPFGDTTNIILQARRNNLQDALGPALRQALRIEEPIVRPAPLLFLAHSSNGLTRGQLRHNQNALRTARDNLRR